jgi:hypothetical protein
MLAEALLKNRVLEAVCEKNCKPGAPQRSGSRHRGARAVFWARGVSLFAAVAQHVLVSPSTSFSTPGSHAQAAARAVGGTPALRLSAHRRALAAGGLGRGQAPGPAPAPRARLSCPAYQAQGQGGASWRLHGAADQSHPSWARLDVGLRLRRHGARWRNQDADHPR